MLLKQALLSVTKYKCIRSVGDLSNWECPHCCCNTQTPHGQSPIVPNNDVSLWVEKVLNGAVKLNKSKRQDVFKIMKYHWIEGEILLFQIYCLINWLYSIVTFETSSLESRRQHCWWRPAKFGAYSLWAERDLYRVIAFTISSEKPSCLILRLLYNIW